MPKFKLTSLDPKELNAVLKQVQAYKKKTEDFPSDVVKLAVDMGVEQAKETAKYMNAYDSGELVEGIVGDADGGKGKIESTAPHSAFVEMGTGVRGKQDPNPENYVPGWEYDVNEHGEAGWFYIGRDGKRHWTKGMPHRPFMYDTAQTLQESRPWLAEMVLQGEEE